eukprot:CAMPEP_0206258420 /NCGR_PEP_ID=MMETSP0047_2-20121206/25907_1 /ASSEMBLY_ACC=CAM_ASM_000192 /TAXON_ID=195065 /ORGANISM="Chroomonas mesostigmatica_cf, Strain CCMP1168" /LENGTH=362 /DNA_ID=CAMNT_0053685157 /DNA_START=172 /DNA_END=1260 /DNA_ORIENTATION=-
MPAQGGFSLIRVSAVVAGVAAACYYTPANWIEETAARYPNLLFHVAALFIAKDFIIPTLVAWCFTGPHMSTRRKTMVATWEPAGKTGEIYASFEFDMTNAKKYIEQKAKQGVHVTITTLVVKAVGNALKAVPSVNGRIVFGQYIPFDSVNVSCLVNIDNGKDLALCSIPNVDSSSLDDISAVIRRQADKLRKGKDEDFEKSKSSLSKMSVSSVQKLLPFVGFLASGLGLTIKALGVKRFLFGGACVTSVGMMGLDNVYVPFTPWARIPIFVMVGVCKDRAVVENGQVVIKPILNITCTIDHRFLDGAQGAELAKELRRSIEQPETYLEAHNAVKAEASCFSTEIAPSPMGELSHVTAETNAF